MDDFEVFFNAIFYLMKPQQPLQWAVGLNPILNTLTPGQGYPWVPSKNVSPFGPAVLPAIADIYTNKYI